MTPNAICIGSKIEMPNSCKDLNLMIKTKRLQSKTQSKKVEQNVDLIFKKANKMTRMISFKQFDHLLKLVFGV